MFNKKIISVIAVAFVCCSMTFALSYKNNTFQVLAEEYTAKAQKALDAGEYSLAEEYAALAEENAALSDEFIRNMLARAALETKPLPKYYVVSAWSDSKDCLWNIAAKPFVYNDPFMWKKLYEANKMALPRKDDGDLIFPVMVIEIPSINGEVREGTYNPDSEYPTYGVEERQ